MEKSKLDYSHFLAMTAFVLIAIGIVFIISAQADVGRVFNLRRIYFSLGGIGVILLFSIIPYSWLKIPSREELKNTLLSLSISGARLKALFNLFKYAILPVFILAVAASIVYLIASPSQAAGQSRRWLVLFSNEEYRLQFQPSELVKLAVVFFIAAYALHFGDLLQKFSILGILKGIRKILKRKLTIKKAITQIFLVVPFYAVPAILAAIIAIDDFGTGAFIVIIMFIMLFAAKAPYWQLITCILVGSAGAYYYISKEQYRLNRMIAFMDLEKASDAIKYQIVNSMTAISTGGIYGKGLGRGVFKWGYIPEDHNDFIFAVICEELGVIGASFVILLFMIILILGFIVALKCKNTHGRLLAIGLSCAISVQAFVNIGVVTSSLPTTGIPLPFISEGGSSLLASSMAIGLLMNIAKNNCKQDKLEVDNL